MESRLKSNSRLIEELTAVLQEPSGFSRGDFETAGRERAAVLALFRGERFIESEILLILRAPDLAVNPGQVALPGGGMEAEDQEDPVRTALRETFEEVGVASQTIQALGKLPALPTVAGHFMVETVIGVHTADHLPPFILQTTEVAVAEWMSVERLIRSRQTEHRVVHGVRMELPFFQWGEQKMWGLTAMIFDLIRIRYDKLFA